ncbi:MAG TPA: HYR domain-containing protein, partial [Pyrinomonadaceae bacterium]|nr:HYR domain-containing protein [Pyrinomonadaceae bacterium]
MKIENARPRVLTRRNALFILFALSIASAIVVVPVYSARSALAGRGSRLDKAAGSAASRSITSSMTSGRSSAISRFGLSQPVAETIATFAGDCTTARTTFYLGETVCAKTDSVTPLAGSWWVNWIRLDPTTVVSGGDHVFPVTTNPQTFTYAPTSIGSYKVSLSNVEGDPSQTPAGFTVVAAPTLATYSGDCTTAKSDFNLGQTICIKVSGLTNTEFPQRRVQLAEPDGFVLQRFNVTDNSQTFSYAIPLASTETFAGETIDHRGTWVVALIDPDADLNLAIPVVVHKSNLLVDRVADLQVSKLLIDTGDPPTAGQDVSFQIFLTNQGPDPATSVTLTDFTLPNTTFQSFTRNAAVLASNLAPRSLLRPYLPDNLMFETNDMRLSFDPRVMLLAEDTPATFNCTSPTAGSAGSTTCTADADIAPGETAAFTAVYHISDSLPNGAQLSDAQSATVSSSTEDPRAASNSGGTSIGATNTTPPSCTLSCPGNITAVADTTGPGVDENGNQTTVPGANVTFSPNTSGTCGTITSNPASGSFFPLGTTPVTISTSDGASCDFLVTVVSSGSAVTISCPAAVNANAGPNCDATVTLGTPTTTGDSVTVTGTRSDGKPLNSTFPVGVTTVHWVASNSSGSDSCDQQVTVLDVTPPTITAVSQTVSAGASCQAVIPDYRNAANDNCACASDDNSEICQTRDDIVVTQDVAAGTSVGLGTTTIHLTATDEANNTSTKTITVTVVDTTAPVITSCPTNVTVYLPLNSTAVSMPVSYSAATATDNCDSSVTIGYSQASGSVFPVGTTTVTVTATDDANNSSTCAFTVTVLYDFTGFFAPVGNPPTLNAVNAGRAVPVKFSLSGDKGLNVFAANNPYTVSLNCNSNDPGVDVTETTTA